MGRIEIGFTDFRVVIFACAAVGGGIGFGAGGETGVEDGSLDVVVWVGVDAIAGLGGLRYLEVPRTPACDFGGGLG